MRAILLEIASFFIVPSNAIIFHIELCTCSLAHLEDHHQIGNDFLFRFIAIQSSFIATNCATNQLSNDKSHFLFSNAYMQFGFLMQSHFICKYWLVKKID